VIVFDVRFGCRGQSALVSGFYLQARRIERGDNEMTILAVIGDVGGHLNTLQEHLIALGVDDDSIPDGVVICQVGDLVHKGADSNGVVGLVDRLMARNPGQWHQLIGNHESQYLPGGTDFWPSDISAETADTIRRWWANGSMRVAASFDLVKDEGRLAGENQFSDLVESTAFGRSAGSSLLVTHAGVTAGAWKLLGRPGSAELAAQVLNEASRPVVWREGEIITGRNDWAAGPLWAIAGSEVYASWMGEATRGGNKPEFAQAHGHTSARNWRNELWEYPLSELAKRPDVQVYADQKRKITRVDLDGQTFFGTDAGAGVAPISVSVPLTFELGEPSVSSHMTGGFSTASNTSKPQRGRK
jgi:hypothetical protein